MPLVATKQNWQQTFRLRSRNGKTRDMLAPLFWLWGVVGLLYNAGTLMSLSGSVGVGTSAYLSATALVWIGGMVLFGFGAMLTESSFDGERPTDGGADSKIKREADDEKRTTVNPESR